MLTFCLSLVLAAAGCTGLLLTARGDWRGPAIGFCVQPVWAVFAVVTGAYGLLATCLMYGYVNAVNLRKMLAKRNAERQPDVPCLCLASFRMGVGTGANHLLPNPNCPIHGNRATGTVGGR